MFNIFYLLVIIFLCIECNNLNGQLTSFKNLRNTVNFSWIFADVLRAASGKTLKTNLDDNYRGLFLIGRKMSLTYGMLINDNLFEYNRKSGKLQNIIQKTKPFKCNLTNTRSDMPPNSVHHLRPGDIDIIAAIGDSLSAGNGIIGDQIIQILNENRGITFSGGGQKNWRTILTLPNILKVFNPQLYGYSTGDSLTVDSASHLNIAEPMIMSRDLSFQIRTLIARMNADIKVDMKKHWKLLTIFVGNNDICSDMCHKNNNEFLQAHRNDLYKSLTILRNNVPRILVNLIPVPNLAIILYQMGNLPVQCNMVHRIGCHCLINSHITNKDLKKHSYLINRWQKIDEDISKLPEFNTKDFSVVYQPLTVNITLPKLSNGNLDLRYFAMDCFHFSQLGHASFANSLWNSMLEPVGKKQSKLQPAFKEFVCPTTENPYIATIYNNAKC